MARAVAASVDEGDGDDSGPEESDVDDDGDGGDDGDLLLETFNYHVNIF